MFKGFFRIWIASALVCLVGGASLAEIVDPDNNVLPDSADLGDIDMSKTKIVDLKDRIAPGYPPVGLTNDVLWVNGIHTNIVVKYANGAVDIGYRDPSKAIGDHSFINGTNCYATTMFSHAEGYGTSCGAYGAHAEGYETKANGVTAHAEGRSTSVFASYSHAEGYKTKTSSGSDYSHAEGYEAIAVGSASHAEGCGTYAHGSCSHAEGHLSATGGAYSHVEGYKAIAAKKGTIANCSLNSNEPHSYAYVWQGYLGSGTEPTNYYSHGNGTFNINPVNGLEGFYIGQTNLAQHIKNISPAPDLSDYPTFENTTNIINDIGYTKALTNALYNLENNAGYYLAVRDMAIAMGASVTNDPYAPIPTPTPPPAVTGKRYAMFIVPVNNETGGQFVGFELKASTNNFENASSSQNILFYAQSEVANSGYSTGGNIDKMKLFVCSNYGGGDFRSYKKIGNTLSWNYELTEVVVIVDSACLVRNPDPDGNWLDSENDELTWVYTRNRNNSPAYEYETGAGKALWRPIAPVKWFSKLPKWAENAW